MFPLMGKDLVLSVYLVYCAVPLVSGLQCLQCQEIHNPLDCSLVGTCGRDEVCLTRRFINFRGQQAYRMGCEEKYVCDVFNQAPSHVLVGRDVNEAICRQCCEENYCNSMLCRETLTNRPTVQTSLTTQPMVPQTTPSTKLSTTTRSTTVSITTPSTTVPSTTLSTTWQTSNPSVMRDCGGYVGKETSGVYEISPDGLSPFNVYCDMSTNVGWTVIQRRFDGSVNFTQSWESYKNGFGSLEGEFWLGNEYLHRLTSVPGKHYTLKFDLTAENGTEYTAYYNDFTVASESYRYKVNFTTSHGDAGDDFRYHKGMTFSTPDRDDPHHCAHRFHTGWWYRFCYQVNINGVYGTQDYNGMAWYTVTGKYTPLSVLKASTMSISSEVV